MSTNAAGCDSTTTLHLTMNYSSSSIDNVTACDSYRWHGVDYTTSTSTPTFATSNAVGCDSTVVLHLTVNYSNTGIDNQTACDSYTWNNVTYAESGEYSYQTTNAAGCDSTVTMHLFIQEVGINTVDGTNAINVYPNPTSGLLNIDAEDLTAIEVYDINGRVVATYGAENKINIASLPAGAYTLRIQTQQGNHIRRIILK